MSSWVEIDKNYVVVRGVVADSVEWLEENLGGVWLQTSYNTRGGVHYNPETGEPSDDQTKALRFNYAGIGFTYDEARDAFIPPKPDYPSWVLDEETCLWVAPVPMPEDGEYTWNEESQTWDPLS